MNNLTQSAISVTIGDTNVVRAIYLGQPVLTFKMIDQVHQRVDGTASRAFKANRSHFVEGEDFYLVDFSQKDVFRPFQIDVPPRGLTVLTQTGYAMLAKVFTDNLAWQVQRELVDKYFTVVQQQPAPQPAPSMFMAGDPHIANQIMLANAAAEMLRMSADSKLKMLYQIGDYHNLATGFLPSYIEDQPTKCLTKLLKENRSRLSAKIVNVVLLELGILEEQERPSTKAENGVKVFKNLTDKGLEYGKNLVNPNNQRETQPHYYVERFPELLRMVNDHLMGNMPIMNGGAK